MTPSVTATPSITPSVSSCATPNYTISTTSGFIDDSNLTIIPFSDNVDDTVYSNIPIGFGFRFYNNVYDNVMISSNGNLQFTPPGNAQSTPPNIPNNFGPYIAPFATDLVLYNSERADAGIYTRLTGSPGSRVFTVYWKGQYYSNPGYNVNVAVSLYEGSNQIAVSISNHTGPTFRRSVNIGIQNSLSDFISYGTFPQTSPFNLDNVLIYFDLACVIPSPTPTPSVTPTVTPSITTTPSTTPSKTPSVTTTPTVTPSISVTPTNTPSISVTPTNTPSISATPSPTPSLSITPSPTPSGIPSNTLFLRFDGTFPVGDPTSVSDWNTFFNLPNNGSVFTNVNKVGNDIYLSGGSNVNLLIALQSNTHILEIIDNGCVTNAASFYECTSLQRVSLPGLTNIGLNLFYNNQSLTSVNLPNLAIITGIGAFQGCYSLQTISFPNLTSITAGQTFLGCSSLVTVYLPSCNTLATTGMDNIFLFNDNLASLTVGSTLATCNSGNPDGDIAYVISNFGTTVTYV
jgi:hypothetical protein